MKPRSGIGGGRTREGMTFVCYGVPRRWGVRRSDREGDENRPRTALLRRPRRGAPSNLYHGQRQCRIDQPARHHTGSLWRSWRMQAEDNRSGGGASAESDAARARQEQEVLRMAVTEGAVDTRQPSRVTVTKRRRRRSESGGFKSTDRLLVGGALATGLALALSVSVALCRPRSLSPRDARRLTAGQPTPAAVVIDRAAPEAGRDNADGSSRHPLSVRSRVSITALAAMVGIALPMGFLLSIQDRLVYKPTRNIRGKPDVYGMSTFEDVAFCTVDGHEIHGWFIRRPYAEYARLPTFIYFHGTDLNCSYRLPKAFGLYSAVGANVFLWSYRGYGLSEGFPSERGLQRDSAAMLEYLRNRPDVNLEQLWVYGESLGGAVAVDFVYRNQDAIRGLILENTFTALIDMIDLVHPYLRLFKVLISRNKWITRDKMPHLKVPVLFLSGQRDGFVPPRMMEQLHALATEASRRRLIKFGQGTHNKTWMMPGYYRAIREFVVEVNGYDHEEVVLGKVERENGWASDGDGEEVTDWDGGAASADGSSSTGTT